MSQRPICISVINMKGGVGKTTITALLARYASSSLDKKVLAIDLDPQANLSQAFMGKTYRKFIQEKQPSIVDIFNGYSPPSQTSSAPEKLDPNDVAVTGTFLGGRNLDLIPSRFNFSEYLTSSLRPDPRLLARFISDAYHDRDLIFIDCAPTESILTQAAYHASRYILVPVKPEFFATIGFPLLQKSLDGFKDSNPGHEIEVIGVVINNAIYASGNDGGPEKQDSLKEIQAEAKKNCWHIFEREIPFSRGFPKIMRGNITYLGSAEDFYYGWGDACGLFDEFYKRLGYGDPSISDVARLLSGNTTS